MQELIFLIYFRVLVKISFNVDGLNDLYWWFANSEVLKYLFFREIYMYAKKILTLCYQIAINYSSI